MYSTFNSNVACVAVRIAAVSCPPTPSTPPSLSLLLPPSPSSSWPQAEMKLNCSLLKLRNFTATAPKSVLHRRLERELVPVIVSSAHYPAATCATGIAACCAQLSADTFTPRQRYAATKRICERKVLLNALL